MAVTDIDGDGKPDVVLVEEDVDYNVRKAGFARVAWIENPGATHGAAAAHIIDRIRSPHSLATLDLDGDGVPELLPRRARSLQAYRSRSNLYAYKKADPKGLTWWRYVVDERFEHHDGLKLIHLDASRIGVLSTAGRKGSTFTFGNRRRMVDHVFSESLMFIGLLFFELAKLVHPPLRLDAHCAFW
ncbi:MAG: VCBS repeat-containing protein [Chloracidobacterium sp.]|nr:VCBS repeat-containing protein [Chloracidobacterium sp.]